MKFQIHKLIKTVNLLVLLELFFSSCKHKTEFQNIPEVKYSTDIAPIISSNCTFSGCHGSASTESFDLLSYEHVIAAGIKSGKPNTSKLYQSLKSYNTEKMMPKKPYNYLTEKQIQLIYLWIGQGAKNN